jgi:heavy metal translocating P-type ATPase
VAHDGRSAAMILLKLGILLSIYAGARLFEVVRGKQQQPGDALPDGDPDSTTARLVDSAASSTATEAPSSSWLMPSQDHQIAHHAHHTRLSATAVGLSVVGLAAPAITAAAPLSVILTVYSTLPMLRRCEKSLLEGKVGNDVLSAVVSVTTVGLGQLLAAALQSAAYHLGGFMALRAKEVSGQIVEECFEEPSLLWTRSGDVEVQIPLAELQPDDVVVVHAGEVVGVDGRIIAGEASIDECALTGEAMPAHKRVGDPVFAGTLVIAGEFDIEVECSGKQTVAARFEALLEQTSNYKSQLQLRGEKWSDGVALPLLGISALSLPVLGPSAAVTMLFAAPTNAIRVMASLQTASHLTSITRQGALVKDGRALEALSDIDTVLMDKTGTVTDKVPRIEAVVSLGSLSQVRLLELAAAVDQTVAHPISDALMDEVLRRGLTIPAARDRRIFPGKGVRGRVDSALVHVGNQRLMTEVGVAVDPGRFERLDDRRADHSTIVFVAVDGALEGAIEVRPRIRPEAEGMLAQLRDMGVRHIALVSGDARVPTRAVATALGLDDYHAEVSPEGKAQLVGQLRDSGHRICFIGDGINDALAMKIADASVSMLGATPMATDTAQLVLLDGSLREFPEAVRGAKRLNRGLRVTLGYTAGYGVSIMVASGVFGMGVLAGTIAYFTVFSAGACYSGWPLLRERFVGPRTQLAPELLAKSG